VGVRAGGEEVAEKEGERAAEGEKEEGRGAEEEEGLAGEREEEEKRFRGRGGKERGKEEREGNEEEDRGEDRGIEGEGIDDRGEGDAGGGGKKRSERGFSAKFTPAEETKVPGFEDKAIEGAEDRLPGAGVYPGVDRGAKREAWGYPSSDQSYKSVDWIRRNISVMNGISTRNRCT